MKARILFAMAAGFSVAVSAAQPENVPELMTTFGGEKVSTVEQWEKVRAPELLKEFTTEEYGKSVAARPMNSRLDRSKLRREGFEPLPAWQDALSRYLKEIGE